MPMPDSRILACAAGRAPVISRPRTYTCPRAGFSSPARHINSVVLPDPLGPVTATDIPLGTDRSTPSRIVRSPIPYHKSCADRTSSPTRSSSMASLMSSQRPVRILPEDVVAARVRAEVDVGAGTELVHQVAGAQARLSGSAAALLPVQPAVLAILTVVVGVNGVLVALRIREPHPLPVADVSGARSVGVADASQRLDYVRVGFRTKCGRCPQRSCLEYTAGDDAEELTNLPFRHADASFHPE